jgi:hypothetical protein
MRETGVAFVVPVYNKEPHLESVLRQIARQEGDFPRQYVFVDDGSTDGSLAALRDLTAGWDDVVIESQDNKGSAGATNRAIALVRQPYIKFVDADDLIGDFATITLLDALDDSPACLAYGNVARYRDESGIDLHARVEHPAATLIWRPLRQAMRNSLFNPTQSLARTAAVREVGGCDERIVHSQEYSLTLRLAQRWPLLRVEAPVAFLPEEAPGRLSDDPAKQLQRVTLALANFLRDHPETEADLKRLACRRAAGRAWKYVYRHRGLSAMSLPWLWRYLWSYAPVGADAADFIDTCCAAFEPT